MLDVPLTPEVKAELDSMFATEIVDMQGWSAEKVPDASRLIDSLDEPINDLAVVIQRRKGLTLKAVVVVA